MPLSAADAIQAKTGTAQAATAAVVLDAGTTEGSTVTVEMLAGFTPITDGGMTGRVPDGFEVDAISTGTANKIIWVFRKSNVAAGEGVAGSTSWDFAYLAAIAWTWRVTEWDVELEPVSPVEATASFSQASPAPSPHTSGTTVTSNRGDVMALAQHLWWRIPSAGEAISWGSYTNGFTLRDQVTWTASTTRICHAWSWAFSSSAASFETSPAISGVTPGANDTACAMVAVYATSVPEVVAGPTMSGG